MLFFIIDGIELLLTGCFSSPSQSEPSPSAIIPFAHFRPTFAQWVPSSALPILFQFSSFSAPVAVADFPIGFFCFFFSRFSHSSCFSAGSIPIASQVIRRCHNAARTSSCWPTCIRQVNYGYFYLILNFKSHADQKLFVLE